ncbi:MAG TPA: hypothetical protein VKB87_06105 [Myxococcaceae bacterium]|nr:hypothetical protein [Myxococcaceae bacterium]
MNSRKNISILTLALLSSSAFAADFPHRRELNARSLAVGLGVSSVMPLVRTAGPGAPAVLERFLSRWQQSTTSITTAGDYELTQDDTGLSADNDRDGWSLKVSGDGTAVTYRNWAFHDAHSVPIDFAQRPPESTLEAWGRRFLDGYLGTDVLVGPNEQRYPLSARYDTFSYQPTDLSAPAVDMVIGNVVVFTRAVNGVDVVGGGSKVAVFFENDGTPYGFDFDWPNYVTPGGSMDVLSIDEINAQDALLSDYQFDASVAVDTRLFECGYFDAGIQFHDAQALIQPGCAYQRTATFVGDPDLYAADPTDGLMQTGFVDVVPAARLPQFDQFWPQVYYAFSGEHLRSAGDDPGQQ